MSKKTETIELRVSPELKSQLGEVCKQRRLTMSTLIRQLVQDEISDFARASTQSGMSKMVRTGSRRLRDLGLVGVSLVALALAWNVATQAPAAAQAEVRITFAEMDRNEDGVVTKEEFQQHLRQSVVFDTEAAEKAEVEVTFDLPQACEADFAALGADMAAPETADDFAMDDEFGQYDADGDGKLLFSEFRKTMIRQRKEEFEAIDSDANGFLTREELGSGLLASGPLGEDDGLSEDCRQALVKLDAELLPGEEDSLRVVFAAFDENRDNRISRREFLNN